MVFATAFDPSVQPTQKLPAQPSLSQQPSGHQPSPASLNPARQTNHLIARASQSRKVSEPIRLEKWAKKNGLDRAEDLAFSEHEFAKHSGPSSISTLPARRVQKDELVDRSSVLIPIELPKQTPLPLGLRLLHRVQQGSTVLTGLLIASALVIYGSSVYVDKSTNQALAQLNALQSESQQLTTANESIKQSLAEQAIEADSGLKPYEPRDMLFVTPEPRRTTTEAEESEQPERLQPLGY
ncbi:MAG: hypothetical protein WA949_10270 [Phormidesmis sp.]